MENQTVYRHKTKAEAELQDRVIRANLQDSDFRNLYWRLWGAYSNYPNEFKRLEHITKDYLKNNIKE